jgi:hypothetical protein
VAGLSSRLGRGGGFRGSDCHIAFPCVPKDVRMRTSSTYGRSRRIRARKINVLGTVSHELQGNITPRNARGEATLGRVAKRSHL